MRLTVDHEPLPSSFPNWKSDGVTILDDLGDVLGPGDPSARAGGVATGVVLRSLKRLESSRISARAHGGGLLPVMGYESEEDGVSVMVARRTQDITVGREGVEI